MLNREQLLNFSEKYGTPLFVYDADLVRERYRDLFRFIPYPKLEIHYALKANYQIGILEALRDEGCGIDAVSPAEVELALRLGFKKESIIYTANNMTDAEFERVFGSGVIMNVGSLSRLGKMAKAHPGARVCLRFNPDVVDGDSTILDETIKEKIMQNKNDYVIKPTNKDE